MASVKSDCRSPIHLRYGVLLITRTRCFGAFGAMFDGGTFEFPGIGPALVLPGFVFPGMGSGTGAPCGTP